MDMKQVKSLSCKLNEDGTYQIKLEGKTDIYRGFVLEIKNAEVEWCNDYLLPIPKSIIALNKNNNIQKEPYTIIML